IKTKKKWIRYNSKGNNPGEWPPPGCLSVEFQPWPHQPVEPSGGEQQQGAGPTVECRLVEAVEADVHAPGEPALDEPLAALEVAHQGADGTELRQGHQGAPVLVDEGLWGFSLQHPGDVDGGLAGHLLGGLGAGRYRPPAGFGGVAGAVPDHPDPPISGGLQ